MKMVLDASVALSWLLEDAGAGQDYAGKVFDALASDGAEARVPSDLGLWRLPTASPKCEARGELHDRARSQAKFLAALAATPIACDPETHARALTDTLQLSRRYRLLRLRCVLSGAGIFRSQLPGDAGWGSANAQHLGPARGLCR